MLVLVVIPAASHASARLADGFGLGRMCSGLAPMRSRYGPRKPVIVDEGRRQMSNEKDKRPRPWRALIVSVVAAVFTFSGAAPAVAGQTWTGADGWACPAGWEVG